MKTSRSRILVTAILSSIMLALPALSLAHGHHRHGYQVVVVKPIAPRRKVVVVYKRPRRGCYYPCWYGPRRAAAHALLDYAWWESRH
ncbi:hypothetical protein [Thiolapillus brandeum]|uniref:hypothetical protein n=1 Tax=Thiolapillus brandeum TaxID=1076588 RepID=UPI000597DBD7|nr:hypothetical protein [Thiolapillus brandeum]